MCIIFGLSLIHISAQNGKKAVLERDGSSPVVWHGTYWYLAILISAIITVLIFVLGTLAIGFIIPNSQINLVQSLLISYDLSLIHIFPLPRTGCR